MSTADQNAGLAALTHELATAAANDGVEFDSANMLTEAFFRIHLLKR